MDSKPPLAILKHPPKRQTQPPKGPIQIRKPQPSPKKHLAGMTKTQLCKLVFEHERTEKIRVNLITNQQALISRQSGALVWTARKIALIAEQFPAVRDEPEFKELFKMNDDLIRQSDELNAQQEAKDGKPHEQSARPETKKAGQVGGKEKPSKGKKGTSNPERKDESGS